MATNEPPRTPVLASTTIPELELDSSVIRQTSVHFRDEERLYIYPDWENNKGEKGPYGEIVKSMMP